MDEDKDIENAIRQAEKELETALERLTELLARLPKPTKEQSKDPIDEKLTESEIKGIDENEGDACGEEIEETGYCSVKFQETQEEDDHGTETERTDDLSVNADKSEKDTEDASIEKEDVCGEESEETEDDGDSFCDNLLANAEASEEEITEKIKSPEDSPESVLDTSLEVSTNIEGLKEEMLSLMRQMNNDQPANNPLLDRVRARIEGSDEEWEALRGIKYQAVECATQLSIKIVELMIILADCEEAVLKIKNFISFLADNEDQNAIVFNKIPYILDIASGEISRMHESKSKEPSREEEKKKLQCEKEIDELINELVYVILHVEAILKYPGLPDSRKLREAQLGALRKVINECKECLAGIHTMLHGIKVLSGYTSDNKPGFKDDDEVVRIHLAKTVKGIWKGIVF